MVSIDSDRNDYIDDGEGIDQLTYSSRTTSFTFALDAGGNIQLHSNSKVDTVVNI